MRNDLDNPKDQEKPSVSSTLIVVFRDEYDIKTCCLIERLHPFDTCKWGKVAAFIKQSTHCKDKIKFMQPEGPISDEQLGLVHSEKFLKNLKRRITLVRTSELCPLFLLPVSLTNRILIRPLRYQTSGTILAALLALDHKTSINLGGGFHHCSAEHSGGFCFFADITLAIRKVWLRCRAENRPDMTILIVDCDAHQGNGYARDVLAMRKNEKDLIYILDMFNPNIYPLDEFAKMAINREVHVTRRTNDQEYLKLLDYHLKATVEFDRFMPGLIIYNAGTDILKGDGLGRLNISALGIVKRDEMVFRFAKQIQSAIVMVLSGGYQMDNAAVIARSILNLVDVI